jgi:hypothetical protein
VLIGIDNPELLTTYSFTLYHGYKVKSVLDFNGNRLNFSQHGDYLDVTIDRPAILDSIRILYEGYNPVYFSNNQGVLLPGFFPYYPREGYQAVYRVSSNRIDGYNTQNPDWGEKDFDITVKSPLRILTNLNTKEGVHSGRSECVSIIGGFAAERNISGYTVNDLTIDPISQSLKEDHLQIYQDEIERIEGLLGAEDVLYIADKIIFTGSENLIQRTKGGTMPGVVLGDHIIMGLGFSPDVVAIELVISNIPSIDNLDKYKGVVFLKNYLQFGGVHMSGLGGEVLIREKLSLYGEDMILKETYRYLKNAADNRGFEAFLETLP